MIRIDRVKIAFGASRFNAGGERTRSTAESAKSGMVTSVNSCLNGQMMCK